MTLVTGCYATPRIFGDSKYEPVSERYIIKEPQNPESTTQDSDDDDDNEVKPIQIIRQTD
ncbi:MAG: hypothetical protein R3D71_06955 [Rickettsiales bacterium]